MSNFSNKFKSLRLEQGFTQKKLADLLHVSQNAIYNWENGKREPNIDMLRRIADLFHVSISELLDVKKDYIKSNEEWFNNLYQSGLLNQIFEEVKYITTGKYSGCCLIKDSDEQFMLTNSDIDYLIQANMSTIENYVRHAKKVTPSKSGTEPDQQHDEDIMDDENF